MINIFLKAKHWQLFLLTFGIPFLFQFLMMGIMFSEISKTNDPDPIVIISFMKYFPLMMILFMGVFFGWLWSITVGLQHKIPENLRFKTGRFKVFLLIPLIYVVIFLYWMVGMMNGLMNESMEPDFSIFMIIIPLHLFSMFCIIHSLYFAAKTFKTVELQEKVSFGDFAGEFFMIWFFFVGVWIMQPKINAWMEGSEMGVES